MKLVILDKVERRTLREMGIHHDHRRTRMRAQGLLRLNEGYTLQQVADEFGVHLNSVENWRRRWKILGLAGLYEGRHTGRPPTLPQERRGALRALANAEGGSARSLLSKMWRDGDAPPISIALSNGTSGNCGCATSACATV